MYEKLIKRTIWQWKCCEEDATTWTDNPPREKYCKHCKKWSEVVEVSVIGPDLAPPQLKQKLRA